MKQIVHSLRTGEMIIAEVPAPILRGPGALVRTRYSLISAGTEKEVIELAKKSLVGKARPRPDLVKQFLDKVKRDGLRAAFSAAMARLDQPLLLGYSSAGEVVAVSEELDGVTVGDRVACGGGGYASHAGLVYVSRNLLVKLPDGVSLEDGSFACVGAVAMQAVRVARLELGERVVVTGLGLIGQILVQIARANGCRVLGCDPDPDRQTLARRLGADEACDPNGLPGRCAAFTDGRGADAVIIAAATTSNAPLEQAAEVSRRRGRIVAVGHFPLKIPRKPFYERELEFRMSTAYGPGRYDADYEEKGIDYPHAYVPWTMQRNMASVIDLVDQGKVDVRSLITHRFDVEQAEQAYASLDRDEGGHGARGMGVLLQYPGDAPPVERVELAARPVVARAGTERVGVGLVGAGLYARSALLPLLTKAGDVDLVGVATATGASANHAAGKFGFRFCTTQYEELLKDDSIDLVVVATRHDLHPVVAAAALRAGKHVWVEKPLAIDEEGLANVLEAQREGGGLCAVGFNRRFAPLTRQALEHIGSPHGPLTISYRCNAGAVPRDHWVYDPKQGGGRIIGEACHFIDLACFLDGSRPLSVFAACTGGEGTGVAEDNCYITLRLASGSVASVAYLTEGDKSFSKERIEILGDGRVFVIEDFRTAQAIRGGSRKSFKGAQDKGQAGQIRAVLDAIKHGQGDPLPLADSVASCLASIRAVESIRSGVAIELMGEAPDE